MRTAARNKGQQVAQEYVSDRSDVPTRTEVFPSSSEALLPPPALLVMLRRLLLLGAGRTKALMGLCGRLAGDPGGELAMALYMWLLRQNVRSRQEV